MLRDETYCYLGIEHLFEARDAAVRSKASTEYLRRVRLMWESPFPVGEKVRQHNSWAIGVLRYFYCPIRWAPDHLKSDLADLGHTVRLQSPLQGCINFATIPPKRLGRQGAAQREGVLGGRSR